jgi:DNA-binding CsgD family transcriptional regulator
MGENFPLEIPYLTITHPSSAIFADGSSQTGYPAVSQEIRSIRKFDSVKLSKFLRLSPRQGTLTALLAEGTTLTIAAEKLGLTLATARWHLREIFMKTATHSQVELIRLAEATCSPEVTEGD